VHRLDKDTSGILIIARTRPAANWLGRELKSKAVKKIYWAIVSGVPRQAQATISIPLVKKGQRGKVRVCPAAAGEPGSQSALTHYEVMEKAAPDMAWLAMMPVTGRTHQLRVHCAAMEHPIIGDGKYGGSGAHPGGLISTLLHLHARSIEIRNPNGRTIRITADLPEHMKKTWRLLEFDENVPDPQFPEGWALEN
jgi:23S rRNA pseudouridine955/2504/2580 synthase